METTIFDLKQGFTQGNDLAEIVLTLDDLGGSSRGLFTLPSDVTTDQVVRFVGAARNVTGTTFFLLNNGGGNSDAVTEGTFDLLITAAAEADSLAVQGSHAHCEFTDLVITVADPV
jgi:hypothetical protein